MKIFSKKFEIGLLAIAIVFALPVSCNDATEIIQDGILDESAAFRTVEDLQLGLNGVYGGYRPASGSNGNGDAVWFNAIFTDNLKRGVDSNGQGGDLYNFLLQAGTQEPQNIWSSRYSVINFANRVLEAMDNLTFTNPDEIAEVNDIRAQLLGMRALCHLDLFLYYTNDYTAGGSLAVINMNFVPVISDEFERNTVNETLAFIRQDLDNALTLFDPDSDIADDIFYMRRDVVRALNVKLDLIEGNYSDAINGADALLADYPLSGITDYTLMWTDAVPGESIFTLSRTQGEGAINDIWSFNGPGIAGNPYVEVSNGLYNQIDDADVRRSVLVNQADLVDNGENDPGNILIINKYPGSGDGAQLNDVKVFRASELQLIKAEAQVRSSQFTAAQTTLQELRTIRGATTPTPDFSSINAGLLEVLKERRVELAFEGQRYLDLKRIGREINVGIVRESVDCSSFTAPCNLSPTDHRFTLPIPTLEIQGNGNITQNPNY